MNGPGSSFSYPTGYDDPVGETVDIPFPSELEEFHLSDTEVEPYHEVAPLYLHEVVDETDDYYLSPRELSVIQEIQAQRTAAAEEEDNEEEVQDEEEEAAETEDQQESEADEEEIETRKRLLETREVEFTSPSNKRIKIELKPEDVNNSNNVMIKGESDGSVVCCSICMNPYSSQGDHQVSSLPCGHLYGFSCIERWIKHSKQRYSKCPICNQKCALKNVTKLYVSRLPVVERGEDGDSVSFQPRDDLYKVHFAKYKEELAGIKRDLMHNTECFERIERISMQDEYVEQKLKEVEESYDKKFNELKGEVADLQRLAMEKQELMDRHCRQRIDEITQFAVQQNKKILSGLQRKLEKQKSELDAKSSEFEILSKATEAKDRKIERLTKRQKRREMRIHPMLKGSRRLMDHAHRRTISKAGIGKHRKMKQLKKTRLADSANIQTEEAN